MFDHILSGQSVYRDLCRPAKHLAFYVAGIGRNTSNAVTACRESEALQSEVHPCFCAMLHPVTMRSRLANGQCGLDAISPRGENRIAGKALEMH